MIQMIPMIMKMAMGMQITARDEADGQSDRDDAAENDDMLTRDPKPTDQGMGCSDPQVLIAHASWSVDP